MDSSQTTSYPSIETSKDPFADAFKDANNSPRVNPSRIASGNQNGVQTLSDSRVFIDSGNGRIVFTDEDGSTITLGIIDNDGDSASLSGFGFSFVNSDGKNNLVLGKLPDGSVNLAIAKDGLNVADAFS